MDPLNNNTQINNSYGQTQPTYQGQGLSVSPHEKHHSKSFLYWAVFFFAVAMCMIAIFGGPAIEDIYTTSGAIETSSTSSGETVVTESSVSAELDLDTSTDVESIEADLTELDQELGDLSIDDIEI